MFERPRSGERAVLVHIDIQSEGQRERLREFEELCLSAGVCPVATVQGSRISPDAKYFVGQGKAEEIQRVAQQQQADVILFNHALSPSQERNLERLAQCRVLDRTGVILDIFAQRARSFEGKLQVELAQLKHLSTRLVRGWTHLERQKGGIGLRGPGETQLETDRRLLANRIKQLNLRLRKVRVQRRMGTKARRKAEVPTISLVGYTNAGKSSLFNRLTGAEVYAANQLFATLDPTLRKIALPGIESAILADTVGFIRHLPHDLIEAFRSTLEETASADLLLHVIDANDAERDAYITQVNEVLAEIGAEDVVQIQVYNKIDLNGGSARIDRDEQGKIWRVWVSAVTGAGMELLEQAVAETVLQEPTRGWVTIPHTLGRLRSQFYSEGAVLAEAVSADGSWNLNIQMLKKNFERIVKQAGIELELHANPQEQLAGRVHGP